MKFTWKIIPLVVMTLILVLSSCDIQKRLYNRGFYVNNKYRHEASAVKSDGIIEKNGYDSLAKMLIETNCREYTIAIREKISDCPVAVDANCDTIFLDNGVRMLVEVVSVGNENVIYRNCASTKDDLLKVETSKIDKIHYHDGNKIDFVAKSSDYTNGNYRKYESYKNTEAEAGSLLVDSALSWMLAGLIFFPGFIVGFIKALNARKKLKGKSGYEQRFKLANTLSIIGGVFTFITLLTIIGYIVLLYLLSI